MLGTRGPRLSPVHGVRYWVLDARELEALPGMTLRVCSAHVSEGDSVPICPALAGETWEREEAHSRDHRVGVEVPEGRRKAEGSAGPQRPRGQERPFLRVHTLEILSQLEAAAKTFSFGLFSSILSPAVTTSCVRLSRPRGSHAREVRARRGRPADLCLHCLLTRPVSPRVSGHADPESDVAFLLGFADSYRALCCE